jgi:AAA+ superfamily predicted ATPase
MLFYKIWGDLMEENEQAEENDKRNKRRPPLRQVLSKTEEFNAKNKDTHCFLSDIDEDVVTFGVISRYPIDAITLTKSYANDIQFKMEHWQQSEVTFKQLQQILTSADRQDYVESDDKILSKFDLDKISDLRTRELVFGENLVNEQVTKETITQAAKELYMDETLLPELDRIYEGRIDLHRTGHPVHYIVETDNPDIRREAYKLLLDALRANGRLASNRYSFLNFEPGESYSQMAYETLYKVCNGGAVVVRYFPSEDEKANAKEECKVIENICRMAKRYRNEVLTVFCISRESEKVKNIFYENLDSMTFVEIREDCMTRTEAADFLRSLAEKNQVDADEELLANIQSEDTHLAIELRETFDAWYGEKLKKSFYPQYKEVASIPKKDASTPPENGALEELMRMVGLDTAKQTIQKALNHYKMQKLYEERGIKQNNPAMHMIFTGNPGTAKTTVARLFARIMKENKLLSKGHLVEVGRGDLVAKFVGWTAQTVQAKFKEAMGGILFIDEAYSLVEDERFGFGTEAINTIVQEMENYRGEMVVIFAGYPDKMEQFLQKNPGMRSRIAFHVPFADYNPKELCNIAKLISEDGGMRLDEGAFEKLETVFSTACQRHDFGNGRYVRNLFEQAKMNQATRLLKKNFDDITTEDILTITADDIILPEISPKTEKRRIGFY